MYPPRSERGVQKKKRKRKSKSPHKVIWSINLLLFVCIILVSLYYIIGMKEQQASTNPHDEIASEVPADTDAEGNERTGESDAGPVTGGTLDEDPDQTPQSDNQESPAASGEKQGSEPADASGTSVAGKTDQPAQQPEKPEKPASSNASSAQDNDKSSGSSVVAPQPSGTSGDVIINIVGDMQFSGKVAEVLDKNGYDYAFAKLGGMFKEDDLTIGNLETPITLGGTGAVNKTFVYKSSPKALAAMVAAGFDAVNLANNHILDQGVEGLVDTLTYLKEYGIEHVGAGMNQDEAYAPVYMERKGMKIALLGFSRVVPETSWKAEGNRAGVAEAYSSVAAVKAIKEARKHADLVIVVAHWGEERVSTPNSDQTRLAHEFVDAGADLIIGGHPHVLQGVELYKGKWIAYSTGNFIFSRSTTEETWKTAVFQARCSADAKCSMKVVPYEAGLGQAIPMEAEAAQLLLEQMTTLSPGIRFEPNGAAATN